MKKLWLIILTAALFILPSCSTGKPTTTAAANNPINIQAMANDLAALKSNFTILNTSFADLQSRVGSNGVSLADFAALQSNFNTLKAKVDAIQIPSATTTPPITDYVKKAELDAANAKLAADEATIASLNTQLAALNAALTTLTARVTALEHPPTTTPPPTTTVAAKPIVTIVPFGGLANLTIAAPATTEQGLLYSLTIQNTSSAVQNVSFTLYFIAAPNFPAASDPNYWVSGYPRLSTMTGGTLYFTMLQAQPNLVSFQSGVTIQPNTTNTYIVNLAVKFQGAGIANSINLFSQVQ